MIGSATAKPDSFAITVNGSNTIGVIVAVDLERGLVGWDVIAGTGVFNDSSTIHSDGPQTGSCAFINRSRENL